MDVQRFFAADISQAIAQVRAALGPDAVILSNRRMDDGVEILATKDYDPSMKDEVDALVNQTGKAVAVTDNTTSNKKPDKKKEKNALLSGSEPFWKKIMPHLDTQTQAQVSQALPNRRQAEPAKSNLDWIKTFSQSRENLNQAVTLDDLPDVVEQPTKVPITNENKTISSQTHQASFASKHEDLASLRGVWDELHNLRSLLEQQLSSLAWGDLAKRFPQRAKVMRHLLEMGLSAKVCRQVVNDIHEDQQFSNTWRKAVANFASRIQVSPRDIVLDGGVFAFVGSTGSGKTTALAKLAARYALHHGHEDIAFITTDNFRVGSTEHLRTFGRILNIPVYPVNNVNEFKKTLKSLYDKQLILIDTPGMTANDAHLSEQFKLLMESSALIKTLLMLPATSQHAVLCDSIQAYRKIVVDGVIITKTDEASSLGAALSAVVENLLPINYVSEGQQVPEDIHQHSAAHLIKQAVAKMQSLEHRIEDEVVEMAFGSAVTDDVF